MLSLVHVQVVQWVDFVLPLFKALVLDRPTIKFKNLNFVPFLVVTLFSHLCGLITKFFLVDYEGKVIRLESLHGHMGAL